MPLNPLISWLIKKRLHQIALFEQYPSEVQKDILLGLVKTAEKTEWGKQHNFHKVNSIKGFKKAFPVQQYEDLKPYVKRLKDGEQGLLWPSKIDWFAKSSGTTENKSKFIPVSKEALNDCHYRGGKDLLSYHYHNFPKSSLYKGKTFIIGGSSELNHLRKDSYQGDLSAIIIKNLPLWVEARRTPDIEVTLMSKWEEKIEKMARTTMNKNITNLSGVPSWTLVLLNRILELKNAQNISEVWPNLQLYMHGGVSFIPYRDQFKKIMPTGINYVESYNASEGYFGIQNDPERDDLLLMLDYGIFYEFMPLEEVEKNNPETIELKDVELEKNYALIISTNAGLWRYMIGDTVAFTSKTPYRFRITGRTKQYINVFGEELMVHNTEKAIAKACEETKAIIEEYTVAPIYMKNKTSGGHEWLIEFAKAPMNIEAFKLALDTALKNLNSDYEAKRTNNLTLDEPSIKVMPKGTFYHWMKAMGKLGGQNKVPRLANKRDYIESILEHQASNPFEKTT